MKNLFLIALLITACTFSCQAQNPRPLAESKELALDAFHALEVSQAIEVEIIQSHDYRAEIRSDYMKYLVIDEQNGVLRIKFDSPNQLNMRNPNTYIKLFTPQIRSIQATSASSVTLQSTFKNQEWELITNSAGNIQGNFEAKTIRMDLSSAGQIEAQLKAENIDVEASSGSTLIAKGTTNQLDIEASSSATVNMLDLKATHILVEASSASDTQIYPTQSLSAEASSNGSILYKTKNKTLKNIHIDESTGGSVRAIQ
ncbi:hypothetical protein GO491_11270 [Flavobacteriaceae bacterium Ap0902]|nr:hypothetical protein [Flavobacteriaceae bacterium Ap0902]